MVLLLLSLAAWSLWLAWYDYQNHAIPNLALMVPIGVAAGLWLLNGHSPFMQTGLDMLLGMALCGCLLLPAYLLNRVGGGDLKLGMLIGALLGPIAGGAAMILAALILGGMAAWQRKAKEIPAAPALLGGLMGVVTAPLWVAGQ